LLFAHRCGPASKKDPPTSLCFKGLGTLIGVETRRLFTLNGQAPSEPPLTSR
jgi:hypothetical protein